MVVDRKVVVENKAVERLSPAATEQLISYLRASPFEVGVLLHFGPSPKFHRFIDYPKPIREYHARSGVLSSRSTGRDMLGTIENTNDTNDTNDTNKTTKTNEEE